MCWQSYKSSGKRISDGKVKVFKVCKKIDNDSVKAYFYSDFIYQMNQLYTTHMSVKCVVEDGYIGTNGFHSYSAKECVHRITRESIQKAKFKYIDVLKYGLVNIQEYFGSNEEIVVVEGYIPEGTAYCINNNGEIISDAIVLTRIKQT